MDEVNRTKCNSIANNTEGRLIDRRDGKIYWVGKLKDGLCWMTQNLDYNSGNSVTTDFNNNVAQYYNPGDYVYIRGTMSTACNSQSIVTSGLNECSGWILANNEITNPDLSRDLPEVIALHYHIGNYYNWIAATNNTTVNTGNASGSICPTGWNLPIGGNDTSIGSFGGLLNGLSNSVNIIISPYYFLYGGSVGSSTLAGVNNSGYYWSSTAYSTTSAYDLLFYNNGINTSNSNSRSSGLSVRCVAR